VKSVERKRKPRTDTKPVTGFLKTGSTMLNLAMSGDVNGGWPLGRINTMPGQSAAGKTILVLSAFAEACLDSKFDDYLLVYDDVERRCDFDLKRLFPPLLDRLQTPSGLLYKDLKGNEDESGISNTIQDLKNNMLQLSKKGKKFIWVSDSLDSFSTDEEIEKEMKKALAAAKSKEAVKKIAGSFNTEKAKILGQILRMLNGCVADTNSLFILTQQLRQRINPMPGQSHYTTSGGEAPYFYSHVRPFLKKKASIKEQGVKIGVTSKITMDKNSITGKLRDIEFNIYDDLGIDDNASMVQFLIDVGHWKGGSWIKAPEFDMNENGKDKLVRAIEDAGKEKKLKRIVQRAWWNREESLKLGRKARY